MVPNYFHLVPRLLAEGFYCDVSRDEIERYLYSDGEYGLTSRFDASGI
jgi:hypothetical protein